MHLQIPSPVQEIEDLYTRKAGIRLLIKRDDLIHPYLSGNKWRKLKYSLLEAKKYNGLVTMGGAFSNHVHASAFAAHQSGLACIIYVRGERSLPLNPTLEFATFYGAKLCYIDREYYRRLRAGKFESEMETLHPGHFAVPEGGSSALGVKGVAELVEELDEIPDYICTAVGSGGTASGLVTGLKGKSKVLGISILKGKNTLSRNIISLLPTLSIPKTNFEIIEGYHFGGYAKIDQELVGFMNWFYKEHKIPLDPIYTSKMMASIYDMVKKGHFKSGETIMALHTGGLQGIAGMQNRLQSMGLTFLNKPLFDSNT